MVTAYDATFARLVDAAGIDVILVGDSVGPVVQGTHNTLPVDLDEMAYHTRSVARARPRALLVGDLGAQALGQAVQVAPHRLHLAGLDMRQ